MGAWAYWNAGVAGFLGAAGVALAAVAAHRVADPSLTTAALFLILHAGAVIGLSALAGGSSWPMGLLLAASLMLFGVALFSGDVTSRVLLGDKLFSMAAPTGGTLLIIAWAVGGIAAIVSALKA